MPDTNPTYLAAWQAKLARPEAPVVTATTRESLTVGAVQGQKYLLVYGSTTAADIHSGDWRQPAQGAEAITFDGLTPGATYSVFTYRPAAGGELDSDASEPAIVTLPEAVSVRLDLGARDARWAENPANQRYTDAATQAYLDAAQARGFIAQTGEKIDMTHLNAATRDGYLPDGWSALDSAWSADRAVAPADCEPGGKAYVEGVPYPCYILTLKANWKLRDAVLTYDPNNGDLGWEAGAPQAQTVRFGATANITAAVPKAPAGKRFAFWKNEKNGATYDAGDTIDNDDPAAIESWGAGDANNGIVLKAVYIDKNASLGRLSFDSMGGSEVYPVRVVIPGDRRSVEVTVNVFGGRTMVTVDGVSQMISNPTRKGYGFEGWRDDEGKAATRQVLTFTKKALEQTLCAEWKGNLHRIIVRNLGETGTQASVEVRYGTPISNALVMRKLKDADMARAHKVIQGFTPRLSGTMPDRDLEVTAIWEDAVYTVTLVYNDGVTPSQKISDVYGAAITDWPTDPTREGYTFGGWKRLGADEVLNAPLYTMPGENRVYGAQWTANLYTITFDSDGGSEVAPITLPYNALVTLPADPVKAHCDFIRWEPVLPERMPAENLTVDAVWMQHDYTITFMDGDEMYYRFVGAYGAKVNPPVDPEREGEVFKGWSADRTAVVELPYAMPDTEPTYYAVWKAAQAAPVRPAGRAVSSTAIQVVDPDSAQEYRWRLADGDDAGWSEWTRMKDGKVEFTGLQPATKYVIQARMIETEDAKPSDPSDLSDPVETLKDDQPRPEPPTLKAGVDSLSVVDPSDAMEYQYADADAPDAWSDWQSPQDGKLTFTGLKEQHEYLVRARLKETATLNPSALSDFTQAYTLRTMVEEIDIIGDPVVGNTLKVRVNPAGVAKYLYYFWYRNDEYVKVQIFSEDVLPAGYQLSEGLEASYTLTEEDIGAKIKLVVMQVDVDTPLGFIMLSDEVGEVREQAPAAEAKKPGPAAKKPVLKTRSRTSLTVKTRSGEEYSIDGGKTWQKKGVFKGLKPNKTYRIIARVAETATNAAGPASKALKAKTLKEPKGMLIAKLTSSGQTAHVITWNSVKNVDGYDVFLARCNRGDTVYKLKLVKSVSAKGKRRVVVKGLMKNVMYKARVRAYIIENGKKVYVIDSPVAHAYTNKRGTNHSNAKRISVNRKSITLKKGKSATIKSKVTPEMKGTSVLGHVAKVRYYSSNKAVATVNKNGRIKAVGKGKCVIYCVTHNGICKTVNVKVK